MNPRHAAALALVVYLLSAPPAWAQNRAKTFTAPDGAFTFSYWDDLVRCKLLDSGWDPPDICTAYVHVCDDLLSGTSVACFAYPRNKFTDTPAFEAATFSVEVVHDRNTEKKCLDDPDSTEDPAGTARINGVSFAVFEGGDSGTGSNTDGLIYRTFHRGKCYQLGMNVATSDVTTNEPPVRKLNQSDLNEVRGKLQQAIHSFRFLN